MSSWRIVPFSNQCNFARISFLMTSPSLTIISMFSFLFSEIALIFRYSLLQNVVGKAFLISHRNSAVSSICCRYLPDRNLRNKGSNRQYSCPFRTYQEFYLAGLSWKPLSIFRPIWMCLHSHRRYLVSKQELVKCLGRVWCDSFAFVSGF